MTAINVTVDRGALAEAIRRRSSAQIAKRADALGVAGVKTIKGWINSELGSAPGSSERHGAVHMRDLDWAHEVLNPGTLPISVNIVCDQINGGPTGAKFWSLNSGRRGGTYTSKGKLMRFAPQASAGGKVVFFHSSTEVTPTPNTKVVKVRSTEQPATEGRDWVNRLQGYLVARASAGFIR